MSLNHQRGSTWKIWDLHVHSPATYGGSYETFIANAQNSIAAVIGINDYCTLAGYEEVAKRGGVPGKVIFPVVELRMNNLLSTKRNTNGIRINFHIIFDNDASIFTKIKTFIASLECYDEGGKKVQLGTLDDTSKVTFDYADAISKLKELSLYGTHALIWLPYDEYGGIDEVNPTTDGPFKLGIINDAHIMGSSTKKQIEFFKWEDEKFSIADYEKWFDRPKPCIKGSDAHKIDYPFGCLQNQQSQPTEKYCWLNADITFEGLKQILVEPSRVFIGEEPQLHARVRNNKTKFIKSLSVKKIPEATLDDVWFNDFHVEFNSGLVAIIGNKGSGKSAITDIISLCGNTHQDPGNFSFLTSSKFRRLKPVNLSDRFDAKLTWEDDNYEAKRLSANPDKNQPERVKYIPQNFLESLCTNVESDAFEKELKQIIYSHTPSEKRLGKTSLDELINYKSSLVMDEIAQMQGDIGKLNLEIVDLENKATKEYRALIQNSLKLKQGELFAHNDIKPTPPPATEENTQSQSLIDELNALREQIKQKEIEVQGLQKQKADNLLIKEELGRALQFYKGLDQQLAKHKDASSEYVQILSKNGLDINQVFTYQITLDSIVEKEKKASELVSAVEKQLNLNVEGSLAKTLADMNEKLQKDQEELDKPAKLQQKYLDDIKDWELKKAQIEGTGETEGTLQYFQAQLAYLQNNLRPALEKKYSERIELAKALYEKKISLVDIRKELFKPVTEYIENFKELKDRYDVKIDVALELKAFPDGFFGFVGQNRVGTYNGKEEGYRKLQDLIEKSQFADSDGFIEFSKELLASLRSDQRTAANAPIEISAQLKKSIELHQLYDYIFSAEYLQPAYSLKLGNKTLQELSPGERGALLLIFYLILDNDDIPLIIDQPEENLDNESVYYILVHFIKKVKEMRQIIIVTHNPNLAVVCDADQIIHMQIEKENHNTIKFLSGAIENIHINQSIINVLEGTLPAFDNRQSKYLKHQIKRLSYTAPVVANDNLGEAIKVDVDVSDINAN